MKCRTVQTKTFTLANRLVLHYIIDSYKIPNRNTKGKIPCSTKEIKRISKAFDNSKNRLKISILDDNLPSKNNSNNAITEVNMNIFKKIRKNINKIGNKK